MKADLTRNTFNPFQHFDRVLMQQGRVQLDADWNEQAAILLHYLRTLAADLIGPQGGPINNWGFGITPFATTPPLPNDFQIGLGRYYVDGILCEADSSPVGFVITAGSPNTITVDQWTLDGAAFQTNQWIEVFDDVQPPNKPAFNPAIVQIAGITAATDPRRLNLTLQGHRYSAPVRPPLPSCAVFTPTSRSLTIQLGRPVRRSPREQRT